MKPLNLTKDDRDYLRKMRITPDDVCNTCHGLKCMDCGFTGRTTYVQHKPQCQGDGCDCGDTNHAQR